MDLEKAVEYVHAHGNAIERARMAAILWDEPPSEAVLQELAALQKPDGGFAHGPREASNICDTASALEWLDDLKLYRGPIADAACRFLLDRQQEDGGWDEVEAVLAYNPPEWRMPGRIATRTWLTGLCAQELIRFGYAEAPGTRCPADFLLAHCDTSGRLAGYERATWLALPMLAFCPGRDSEPFRKAVVVVEASYSPDQPGSYLAWLLRCLQDAGLPAEHPLVARALADLQRRQQPNGSWESEDAAEFAVGATVEALRVLKGYGLIAHAPTSWRC
ncbi:MAG: terpene cyclase/mutase family protein [Chloroflexi bacterium]|nr:terpene cyclase/mutase family protein [Chloroflexota bacterium]